MHDHRVSVDLILRDMKRGRPYVLGLAHATLIPECVALDWGQVVAHQCYEQSHRKTLLIQVNASIPDASGAPPTIAIPDALSPQNVNRVQWSCWTGPLQPGTPDARRSLAELATLPQWKEHYPLVVIQLGSIDSYAFASIGRQCDAIALLADPTSAPKVVRTMTRKIKQHRDAGLRLVGMWALKAA